MRAADVLSSATRMLARLTMSRETRRDIYWRCNGSEALWVSEGVRILEAMAVAGMGDRDRSWLK